MKKHAAARNATINDDFDRLFVVGALLGNFVDGERIADAYRICAARPETTLPQVLLERGWLAETDRSVLAEMIASMSSGDTDRGAVVRRLLEQKLSAALDRVRDPDVRRYLQHEVRPVRRTTTRLSLFEVKGEGGLGRVWLARDEALGRDVAVKELRAKSGDAMEARKRFMREARILGRLEHPGVVPVYGLSVGAEIDDDFYSMRFVGGRTMEAAITEFHSQNRRANENSLALSRLLEQLAQVASTVAFAHSRGIVHRDLKPANVMLGDFGEVVVVDWGLAKVLPMRERDEQAAHDPVPSAAVSLAPIEAESGGTVAGDVLGSPLHMAPEQAEGRPDAIGPATDVFGLGGILFQILTGEEPHRRIAKGKGLRDVIATVARSGPLRPRALVSRTPKALDRVCSKATAHDSKARYDSALDFGRDLQRWIAGESVSAFREPTFRRLGRWIGRHRGATLISASVVTVGIVIAIALTQAVVVERTIVAGVVQGRLTMLRHEINALISELGKGARAIAAAEMSDAGLEQFGATALREWPLLCRMAFYPVDESGTPIERLSIKRPRGDSPDLTVTRTGAPATGDTIALLRPTLEPGAKLLFVENLGFDQTVREQGYVLRALVPIRRQQRTIAVHLLDIDLRAGFEHQFESAAALMVAQQDAFRLCDRNWRVFYNAGASIDGERLDRTYPWLRNLRAPLQTPHIRREEDRVVCVDTLPIPADKGDRFVWVVVVLNLPPAPWRHARFLATALAVVAGVALTTFLIAAWVRRRRIRKQPAESTSVAR